MDFYVKHNFLCEVHPLWNFYLKYHPYVIFSICPLRPFRIEFARPHRVSGKSPPKSW